MQQEKRKELSGIAQEIEVKKWKERLQPLNAMEEAKT